MLRSPHPHGSGRASLVAVGLAGLMFAVCGLPALVAEDKPLTGPETEKRFPPLIVPDGFRATLFACDPLVEYPSVIALGPEPATLFVAHDYVTGLGVEIVRRDEIRLLRDRNRDGYADESKLYAGGFNSIQGLAYAAGTVFVMHAPFLTSLKDTDGDGIANERRDLITGLGLPPEENDNRLHCANGVVVGHDGWLYLALGDRGCDVLRPEGDRLVFHGGGILRCRADGRDLHLFSRGLRNIYDIALDDELNVFVRDNENDGGDYMIRVYQCFHGSDHGYPYLYRDRPDEAQQPLADLGRGSSAGGTSYLETAFPQEYRDSLFFCEWGRAVVRYPKERAGSSFAPMKEIDFAAGAPDDPYGFKPTDLVVDYDGSLLISDWGDGQRPKRGRGRIYRISYKGGQQETAADRNLNAESTFDDLIKALDSPSYHVRVAAQELIERRGKQAFETLDLACRRKQLGTSTRLHAVWILAHTGVQREALVPLLSLAMSDPEPRVRAQAVRAIADMGDPVLVARRLDAGRADGELLGHVSALLEDKDPRVQLEVLVALGRFHWNGAPSLLRQQEAITEPTLSHAAVQLLRRSDNWRAVLKLLDARPEDEAQSSLRAIALRALADQANETVVDGLLSRVKTERDPKRRTEYLDLLSRIYRQPAEWTYWGFRPPPRPANSVDWGRTERIGETLDEALADSDFGVRAAIVRRMLREAIPIHFERLTQWLSEDTGRDGVAAILAALEARPAAEIRPALDGVMASRRYHNDNRLAALTLLVRDLDAEGVSSLRKLADTLDEGPVLAAVIRELAQRSAENLSVLLMARIASKNDDVRSAAAVALAEKPIPDVAPQVVGLLADHDVRVRRAAALLAGKLEVRDAKKRLLAAVAEPDRALRRAGLESLLILDDGRAVASAASALDDAETQVAAINYLGRFGSAEYLDAVRKSAIQTRSLDVLRSAGQAILNWRELPNVSEKNQAALDRTIAEIHGASGVTVVWRTRGSIEDSATADPLVAEVAKPPANGADPLNSAKWRRSLVTPEGVVRWAKPASEEPGLWLAATDILVDRATDVELLVTAKETFRLRLNGTVLLREQSSDANPQSITKFDSTLEQGLSRLVLEFVSETAPEFQLSFRAKSSKAAHERLTKLVLETAGNAQRGRELFLNAEKTQCVRCHRLGEEGGRIGPDLAGIGSRFSRIHLIESVLEPSRTIAPSYETLAVALASGQVLNGVKSSETETELILGDTQGNLHKLSKSDIDDLVPQSKSTMPDGLEQRFSDREFLDLIEFLSSLKKPTVTQSP